MTPVLSLSGTAQETAAATPRPTATRDRERTGSPAEGCRPADRAPPAPSAEGAARGRHREYRRAPATPREGRRTPGAPHRLPRSSAALIPECRSGHSDWFARADFRSSSGAPMLDMRSSEVGRMEMARHEREHLQRAQQRIEQSGRRLRLQARPCHTFGCATDCECVRCRCIRSSICLASPFSQDSLPSPSIGLRAPMRGLGYFVRAMDYRREIANRPRWSDAGFGKPLDAKATDDHGVRIDQCRPDVLPAAPALGR